ncbi:MAG: Epoxide hydrolase, partial [uncultured Blastococcus sp.]
VRRAPAHRCRRPHLPGPSGRSRERAAGAAPARLPADLGVVGRGVAAAERGRTADVRPRPAGLLPRRAARRGRGLLRPEPRAGDRGSDDGAGDPGRRRRGARLGRERRLDAGCLASRPRPFPDRGLGAAPGRLHRGVPGRPGAEGAVGVHPAVLAGRQGRGGAARRRRPPAAPDAVGRRRAGHRDSGGVDRRVRRGAVGARCADRGAELVPRDELGHPGGPGRGADDVRVERRRRGHRADGGRGLRQLRERRLPVRRAAGGHALDSRAGPGAARPRRHGPHRVHV